MSPGFPLGDGIVFSYYAIDRGLHAISYIVPFYRSTDVFLRLSESFYSGPRCSG